VRVDQRLVDVEVADPVVGVVAVSNDTGLLDPLLARRLQTS
jgi:hypothetical protein